MAVTCNEGDMGIREGERKEGMQLIGQNTITGSGYIVNVTRTVIFWTQKVTGDTPTPDVTTTSTGGMLEYRLAPIINYDELIFIGRISVCNQMTDGQTA